MTDADRPYIAKMLAVFSSTYNEPVDDLKAEAYFAALAEFSVEDVRTAAHAALRMENFFPRPARLRELIVGSGGDQAEVAWAKLLQQIRWEGYTGKPDLSEATWDIVRELWGSWANLCQTLPGEGPELLGWQKRFISAYGSARRVAKRMELPLFRPAELPEHAK